jgi:1-acyl-sn-glycerol-3-phosphate acyltransferase
MMRPRVDHLHAHAEIRAEPRTAPMPVKRSDAYWLRLPATGLCFLVFGLATCVLGCVVLPLIRIACRDRDRARRAARATVGGGLRAFVGFMRAVGVLRYSFDRRERLGRPGQVIVANHPTLIDAAFLLGFVPSATCIVKEPLFRNFLTRGAVVAAGYIRTLPTDDMIHTAEQALRDGQPLVIFPEGTRTVPGRPLQMQRAAANIALRGARVLTPVFIDCQPPTLSKHEPWYRIPARRAHFTLRVGDDLDLESYRREPLPAASRRLNADLVALFTTGGERR